jgi:hypothetical protein
MALRRRILSESALYKTYFLKQADISLVLGWNNQEWFERYRHRCPADLDPEPSCVPACMS